MSDVFISYKRENLAVVNRLVEALRAESVDVWWDQDIPPNAPWEATIEKALAAAKLIIVAWSPASVASDNVKAEARWARGQGLLLQVFVEACEPPLFFGERQGVDLKGWSGGATDPAFRSLVAAVWQALASAPAAIQALGVSPGVDAGPPPLPGKPSIAVLPFANLSGDPEQEYFADGMVEEITTALSRCKLIFVIGGGSSLALKGKGTAPQEAARLLGVRYVLEGSVRKAAGRVRIAVKLVDGSDGAQVWAERFEDSLEDVFALQDHVALGVAGVIEPAVVEADLRRAASRPTDNMGSYDLCLRGMALFRSPARAGVLAALELLNQSLALDPDYGLALVAASNCHAFIIVFGWSDNPEAHLAEARSLIQRAMRTANDDAVVLANVASVLNMIGDPNAAAPLAERALALNPGSSIAWLHSGWVQLSTGDPQVAFEQFEASLRLDPLSQYRGAALGGMGAARFRQRRFEEAARLLSQSMHLSPDWPLPHGLLAACKALLGAVDEAREAMAAFAVRSSAGLRSWANVFPSADMRKLILEGIDLAEGRSPAEA